jgi:hypothetical protein
LGYLICRLTEVCTGADLAAATCGFFWAASADEAERAKAAMAMNDTNLVIISSLKTATNLPLNHDGPKSMQRIMTLLKSASYQVGLGDDPKGSRKLCWR